MKKSFSLGVISALLLVAALSFGSAQAATIIIGFDNLVSESSSYTEDGFNISTDSALRTTGFRGNPGPEMYAASSAQTNTLSAVSGDPFNLLSIDLTGGPDINGGVWPQTLTFEGAVFGGGSVSQTFEVSASDIPIVWNTFAFDPDFRNLVSVSWMPQFTLADNITLSPVPIPAAMWLFATALIGFVGISRRRKVA